MIAAVAAAVCVYRSGGALPDPKCTPGALNQTVTQATIHQTICVKGWTATIRPPLSVTEPQKYRSMKAYGLPKGTSARGYEYDHLVPLEIGGAPDDSLNLWPEAHPLSYLKDKAENRVRAAVCAGRITLAKAQGYFLHDWRKAP